MSVINQMLKDLEQRQQAESSPAPVLTASTVKRASPPAWLWVLVILASAAISVAAYHFVVNAQPADVAVQPSPVTSDVAGESTASADTPRQEKPQPAETNIEQSSSAQQDFASPETVAESKQAQPDEPGAGASSGQVSANKPPVSSPEEQLTAKQSMPLIEQAPISEVAPPSSEKNIQVAQAKASAPKPEPVVPAKSSQSDLEITPVQLSAAELADVKYRQAKQALAKQRVDKGLSLLNQAVELEPDNIQARVDLANQYYQVRQIADVVRVLEKGIRILPENTQFRLMLAKMFMENNNLQQAYSYTMMMPQGPEIDTEYMTIRAGLAQRLSRFAEAQESYRALVEHQPRQARWWLGLAVASDKLKQPQVALEAYQRALGEAGLSDASRRFAEQRVSQLEAR